MTGRKPKFAQITRDESTINLVI